MSSNLIIQQKEIPLSVIRRTKERVKGQYKQLTNKILPFIGVEIGNMRDSSIEPGHMGIKRTKQVFYRFKNLAIELFPEAKPSFEGAIDEAWIAHAMGATGIKDESLSKSEYDVLNKIEMSIMNNSVIKNIPQLPKIAPRLINALKDDAYPWAEFSITLSEDKTFQKRFMAVANSPALGLKAEAKSIEQLLFPLSKSELKQAVLITAISYVMEFDKDNYGKSSRINASETAFKTAISCKTLANDGFELDEANAFITGLTYYVGIVSTLRIMRNCRFETNQVYTRSFVKRLHQLIALMSYQVALAWKLPKKTRIAIKEQAVLGHNPKLSPLGEALYLASRIAMAHYLSKNKLIKNSREKVAEVVGLDRLAVCETSFETLNDIQNYKFST